METATPTTTSGISRISSDINDGNGISATIPAVVQRALGMHNIEPHFSVSSSSSSSSSSSLPGHQANDKDDVVRGLEGFFLPSYLLLRFGHYAHLNQHHHHRVHDDIKSALPGDLMRAWDEMHRGTTTTITAFGEEGNNIISKSISSKSCRRRSTRSDVNRKNGKKRKRKSHHRHHHLHLPHEMSNGESTDEMNTDASALGVIGGCEEQQQQHHHHHSSNKRRRKNRRRSSRKRKGNTDDNHVVDGTIMNPSNTGCNKQEDSWVNYQILARIIVAPFTSSLLGVMKQCKQQQQRYIQIEDMQQQQDHQLDTDAVNTDYGEFSTSIRSTTNGGATKNSSIVGASTTHNVYQTKNSRSATTTTSYTPQQHLPNTKKKNYFLSLTSPQESLETIVDGAICTLVRRTHRFRCQSSSSSSSSTFKRNCRPTFPTSSATAGTVGRRAIHRRRRDRKNKEESTVKDTPHQTNIPTAATNSSTSNGGHKQAGGNDVRPSVNNHWLLEENLLSTGYSLGSGDTTFAANRNDGSNIIAQPTANQQQQQHHHHHLRGCPNMAPGIHCIHPNPLSSYGRSSTLMKFLHGVIGDDALREILVNCIVLIPTVSKDLSSSITSSSSSTTTTSSSSSSSSSSASFHRGNYFQLCGPPMTMLAKKFDGISNTSLTAATSHHTIHESRHRKRKRSDVESTRELDCVANYSVPIAATNDRVGSSNENENAVGMEERWDPNKPIPRGNLFYCDFYSKHIGLSPRHLLNQHEEGSKCHATSVDVRLLNAMTQLWPVRKSTGNKVIVVDGSSNKRRSRWRRLRKRGIDMCTEMRRRHQQCNYSRLLEHYCPLPAIDAPAETDPDGKALLSRHATLHHTPVVNVVSFLKAVLRCAFPSSFWGSRHNFHQVVRTIRVFSNLGRTEQLPEKAIVDGIRVLDMKWLLPDDVRKLDQPSRRHPKLSLSTHKSATGLVRNVMRWLYCQFVIPLLRSTFYITETEFTGSRVLYYRKPVWTRIKSLSMKILLKQQYREMSAVKVQKLLSNHNVGCPPAPLRILPKATGIRAIAMLSKSSAIDSNPNNISGARNFRSRGHGPAPNKILQSTFHALQYEYEKRPSLFGAGVLGLTEVFPSFCSFVEALKQRELGLKSTAKGGRTPLYFASADIKHCYDTINQKRLYELMRSVVDEDVYLTKNNFILHCNNKNRSLCCRWKKRTFSPDQLTRFHHATSNDSIGNYFNSIFVEGVHCSIEKRERISGLLRDHIFGQVLVANGNHGQRYLLQHSGIPQGSILSSMLCNIYFGNIEEILLDGVFEIGSSRIIRGCSSTDCDAVLVQDKSDIHLLVRIVDDFLLISTNKSTSARFMKKLNEGIPSLGVAINGDKSRVNYPLSLANTTTGKLGMVTACHDLFPWCGLLIDTRTCEISLDYKRFCGSHSTDTVVIHRGGNEGLHLKKKLKDFVRPRCCQRLLFSSDVNRIDMIRLNFYQTFLLCAVKLVHYITSGSRETSAQFIYDAACDTIHFAFALISSKIQHGNWRASSSTNKRSLAFQLSWKDALWLGRHAFRHVLRRQWSRKMRGRSESYIMDTQKVLLLLFSDSHRSLDAEGTPSTSAFEKDLLAVTRRARQFPLNA